MIKHIIISNLILFILLHHTIYASTFDELDKPPEGAHKGQMLLGAYLYFGIPYGSAIDAEDEFLEGSTYEFDNGVEKAIQVSHLSFGIGLTYEYMPLDFLGINSRIQKSYIVQRTNFGQSYENWRGYLYSNFAFYIGPSLHASNRKGWDFTLIPLLGYAFSKYNATPIAEKTLDPSHDYSGKSKSFHGYTYGAELNCLIYFSGGLYISIGFQWIRNPLDFGNPFNLTNPDTGAGYFDRKSSGNIDSFNLIIISGYAFSN